ncbi:hypothetical protein EJ05DRAFT_24733 [Pseudovirgaria hyperparasitica]|uniref:Heterokaryon incompatibility domain-containing protein n=1 Tax=Pseudovirgaria hyperparasitica TaxID=470096 RepID=A0A6A6WLN1_9PEZI|nr:uncharacterized protein EJ05DRAFT_24733 [Pseudovirgaria hyperparasitica]KAF2763073.1 hypothetical protein EJ05DRAFT_24733 [Pseudovirgaria hyperparasitica]
MALLIALRQILSHRSPRQSPRYTPDSATMRSTYSPPPEEYSSISTISTPEPDIPLFSIPGDTSTLTTTTDSSPAISTRPVTASLPYTPLMSLVSSLHISSSLGIEANSKSFWNSPVSETATSYTQSTGSYTSTSNGPTSTISTITTTSSINPTRSPLSSSAIGGITGGGIAALFALLLIWWCIHKGWCLTPKRSNGSTVHVVHQHHHTSPKVPRVPETHTSLDHRHKIIRRKQRSDLPRSTRYKPGLDDERESPRLFQRLPQGWILLAHLQPGEGNDALHCEIRDSTQSEKYEALSWVWFQRSRIEKNSKKPLRMIPMLVSRSDGIKDGQHIIMWITPNLARALWKLRPPLGQTSRPLWIDMLCIIQGSSVEAREDQEQQLPLMASIYGSAQYVIAWLGEIAEGIEFIFEQANLIIGLDTPFSEKIMPYKPFVDYSPKEVQIIHDFALRDYWTRIWIVQEFALSNSSFSLIFKSDELETTWPQVNVLINDIDGPTQHGVVRNIVDDYVLFPGVVNCSVLAAVRKYVRPAQILQYKFYEIKHEGLRLLPLIHYLRNHMCGEPMDRFMALKSLTRGDTFDIISPQYNIKNQYVAEYGSQAWLALERFFPRVTRPVKYHRSELTAIAHTYGQLVELVAILYGRLDALNCNTGQTEEESLHGYGLSSWIPNLWSPHTTYSLIDGGRGPETWFQDIEHMYSAGMARPPAVYRLKPLDGSHYSPDPGKLLVTGFQFDYIDKILPQAVTPQTLEVPLGERTVARLNDALLTWAENNAAELDGWGLGIYRDWNGGYDMALRRMLVANVDPARAFGNPTAKTSGHDLNFCRSTEWGQEPTRTLTDVTKVWPQEIMRVHLNRRMFRTRMGYIGVGPEALKKGDLVVILFGGQTPYVLRENSLAAPTRIHGTGQKGRWQTYKFLGECYVDGIMGDDNGTADSDHRQDFVLE